MPVLADDHLGESFTASNSSLQMHSVPLAQTFTPTDSTAGTLDYVTLLMATNSGPVSGVLQVTTTSGGKPTTDVLAYKNFSGLFVACCRRSQIFYLSNTVELTSGITYAIVVRPTGYFTWFNTTAPFAYERGQEWQGSGTGWNWDSRSGYDFCFQTWLLGAGSTPPPGPVTTASITGAPSSSPEGTTLTLTGSGHSTSTAMQNAGFTYAWSATKNGATFGTPGTGSTYSLTPDDEGTFSVTLTATDSGGNKGTTTATITGANVAPTAKISSVTHASIVLVALQNVSLTGGFTDPGLLDEHSGTIDWGDGTAAETYPYGTGGSGDVSEDHQYTAAKTYTISYTVTDDDNGTSTATWTVIVETPDVALAVISRYITSMASLSSGEKNGLLAKYQAAQASAARGDFNATCGQLDAAMNDLEALTNNGHLSTDDSAALSSATWAVHRALGCTKIKVGWLTLSL